MGMFDPLGRRVARWPPPDDCIFQTKSLDRRLEHFLVTPDGGSRWWATAGRTRTRARARFAGRRSGIPWRHAARIEQSS